jgi:hypothetical protein
MRKEHPGRLYETDDEVANQQTASLAGVAITLLLAVLGLYLVRGLQPKDTIGDCLSSRQMNCNLGFHDTVIQNSTLDLIRAAIRSVRWSNSQGSN